MPNNVSISQQIIEEAENLGIALGDGFEFSDMPLIIEAVARVMHSCEALWTGLDNEERKTAVLDMVMALDDQYDFSGKMSTVFVAWDIPGLPDNVVDLILSEGMTKKLIRSFYGILVDSVFKSLTRKSARGLGRGWK